jgi:hypothetical protein
VEAIQVEAIQVEAIQVEAIQVEALALLATHQRSASASSFNHGRAWQK